MRPLRWVYRRLPWRLRWRVMRWVWPLYECENCNGVCYSEYGTLVGCECQYYGAPAPGVGPGRVRSWLQHQLADWKSGVGWMT